MTGGFFTVGAPLVVGVPDALVVGVALGVALGVAEGVAEGTALGTALAVVFTVGAADTAADAEVVVVGTTFVTGRGATNFGGVAAGADGSPGKQNFSGSSCTAARQIL